MVKEKDLRVLNGRGDYLLKGRMSMITSFFGLSPETNEKYIAIMGQLIIAIRGIKLIVRIKITLDNMKKRFSSKRATR